MKICKNCKKEKDIKEFYLMSHGYYHPLCFDCKKIYHDKYQKENAEKIKKVNNLYYNKNTKTIIEKQKIYAKKHIPEHVKSNKKWRENNPEKYLAQSILGHAVERDGFKKQPCKTCGTTKHVHAHHSDYSKPLEVAWLCPLHHKAEHKKNA